MKYDVQRYYGDKHRIIVTFNGDKWYPFEKEHIKTHLKLKTLQEAEELLIQYNAYIEYEYYFSTRWEAVKFVEEKLEPMQVVRKLIGERRYQKI